MDLLKVAKVLAQSAEADEAYGDYVRAAECRGVVKGLHIAQTGDVTELQQLVSPEDWQIITRTGPRT